MSQVNEVPVTPSQTYTDAAQVLVEDVRGMRQKIPNLVIPESGNASQKLVTAATVPPQFVELTAVAVRNSAALVRGGGADPVRTRDLMSYADAFLPLADELEALAHFIRHSALTARNIAGSDALTTYALAQRLAKRPETADLAPHVADMRNALGKRFGGTRTKPAPKPAVTKPPST